MTKEKSTMSINGGKEIDLDDKEACIEALTPMVERALGKTPAPAGHNKVGGVAADQLKSIIARVEKLEEEKSGLSSDIRDVFAEAKGNGFDVRTIRTIIKMRKMDASEREEAETILDTYLHAIGMQTSMELE